MRTLPYTLLIMLLVPALAASAGVVGVPDDAADAAPGSFELIGHDPLFNRGMNAALAVHGDYAYVGSRTDGKPGDLNLTRGGVMVVNVSNPKAPVVSKELGLPNEAKSGESARELRVWKSQDILIVLHTNCGTANAHICQDSTPVRDWTFYDISGANAGDPKLLLRWKPSRDAHEFFLWEDPENPNRALLYVAPGNQRMQVYDISPVLEGKNPTTVVDIPTGIPTGGLHSLTVSNDGSRAYLALLKGGFAVADVSEITQAKPDPKLNLITPNAQRPTWPGLGAHSAVRLWNSPWAYVSDEVYGTASQGEHGCPWGWARMIDISDPTKPVVKAEYKLPENQQTYCAPADRHPLTSFSAHNPTVTPNIVFTTWHSGGLQAIDVSNPATPAQLAEFKPTPLTHVITEDPRLSAGQDKVVMWSFPIISDGLIYVADLRNGLYILKYKGPHADEVDAITFLEGNSNLGDALCYEPVGDAPAHCDR